VGDVPGNMQLTWTDGLSELLRVLLVFSLLIQKMFPIRGVSLSDSPKHIY
jgi:hypothetical protein